MMDSSNRFPVSTRNTEPVFNLCLLNFPEPTGLEFSTRLQHGSKDVDVEDCLSPPTSISTSPSSSDLISMPSELSDSRGSSSFNGILASDTEHSISEKSASPVVNISDAPSKSTIENSAKLEMSATTSDSYAESSRFDPVPQVSESLPNSATSGDPCHFPPDVSAAPVTGYGPAFTQPLGQHYGSASQFALSPHASSPIRSPHPATTTYHSHPPAISLRTRLSSSQSPSMHTSTADSKEQLFGHDRTASQETVLHRQCQSTTSPYRPHLGPSVSTPQSDGLSEFRHVVPYSSPRSYSSSTRPQFPGVYDFPTTSPTKTVHNLPPRYSTQVSASRRFPSRRLFQHLTGGQTICHSSDNIVAESHGNGSLLPQSHGYPASRTLSGNVGRTTSTRSIVCCIQNPYSTNSKRHVENPCASAPPTSTKRRRSTNKKEQPVPGPTSSGTGNLLPRPLLLQDVKKLLHEGIITTPTGIYPPSPRPLQHCFPLARITPEGHDLWKVDVNGCALSSNKKYTSFPYYLRRQVTTSVDDSEVLFRLTGLFDQVISPPDLLSNNFLISARQRLLGRQSQVSSCSSPASPRGTRSSGDALLHPVFNPPTNERSTTPPLAVRHRTSLVTLPVRPSVVTSASQSRLTHCSELSLKSKITYCSNCVTCSQCEMQIMSSDRILHFQSDHSENCLPFCSLTCLIRAERSRDNLQQPVSGGSTGVRIVTPFVPDSNGTAPVLLHPLSYLRVKKELTRRGVGRRRQPAESSGSNRNPLACLGLPKRWSGVGWCRAAVETPKTPTSICVRSLKKTSPETPPEPSWYLLASTSPGNDSRSCSLCHQTGDASNSVSGRLLNCDMDTWVHLNCILWCYNVYETVSGGLEQIAQSVEKANNTYCSQCGLTGAGLPCYNADCSLVYHLPCAHGLGCVFHADRSMYCPRHRGENTASNVLDTLAVQRRVFISRDEYPQVAKVIIENAQQWDPDDSSPPSTPSKLRVGSLILHSVGQLLPDQIASKGFHNKHFIYPVGYSSTRIYWSYRRVGHRCLYHCRIEEGLSDITPTEESQSGSGCRSTTCAKFVVTVEDSFFPPEHFSDKSCNGVWQQILARINESRQSPRRRLMRICQQYMRGETLFGLTEPHIIRAIESLPGLDRIEKYVSKFDRRNLIKGMPLAINPTGCARAEPKLRTHVRNRRPIGDSASCMSTRLTATCRGGPLSRSPNLGSPLPLSPMPQSAVSKSQQYRHLQVKWRGNVNLARSRIQGLGLHAARDINRNTFIIEYLGEVIRNEVGNRRERLYQLQNRGIYMFRVDNDLIVDATMCGGLARYINHSCEPNCTAEILLTGDNGRHNSSIVIVARRDIKSGEELTYDYTLDVEEDVRDRIPCKCHAQNCRKWMN